MDLLDEAERVVRQAMARGADQAEAYVEQGASMGLDLEQGAVTGSSRSQDRGGAVRVLKGGSLGFAYYTDPKDAPKAVDDALRLSTLAPVKPFRFPHGAPVTDLAGRWDEAIAGLDPDMALGLATDLLQGAKEAAPQSTVAGGVSLGWSACAIANSEGVACADRATSVDVGASLILADGERSINAWDGTGQHAGLPDAHAVGHAVGTTVMDLRAPMAVESGVQDLVFRPDAVAELVTGVVLSAVDGDDALRGKSFWSDRMDAQVADAAVSLFDDPRDPAGYGTVPFDGEGVPATCRAIIEDGVLRSFLFDSRDAADHGRQTTGHAVRSGFKSPPGTGAHHVVLEGKAPVPEDRLVAGIDDGILVDSVLGAHTANATTGDFSVTAANAWRIEGGAVAGACQEVAIGGNLSQLLLRLDGVGDVSKVMSGARIPALRFRDVQVSA